MRGDAGEKAKDGKSCPICASPVPPSLGFKPRTYCSRECLRASSRPPKPAFVPCNSCGEPVPQNLRSKGRPRNKCSEECRRQCKTRQRRIHEKTCLRCGKLFLGVKNAMFCGESCRYKHRLVIKPCERCGRDFKQRRHDSRFCSNDCSLTVLRKSRRSRPAKLRQCMCCHKPFRKRRNRNAGKYCSRACAFEARRLKLPCAVFTRRYDSPLYAQLAAWFSSWGNDAQNPLFVDEAQGTGYRSRCLRYGCHFQSFSRRSIFVRDSWRCQICHRDLLRRWTVIGETATPHPRNPTIDHIVPLSCGPSGPGHRPNNVQAACWECNIRKSDSLAAILPTVGDYSAWPEALHQSRSTSSS